MNNKASSVIKISALALALVLSFGLSYALAWTAPTATPPGANVAAPINASATAQVKTGDLTLRRLFTTASSTVGTTTAVQSQTLTVVGTIGATEDICTAAGGGKCLSTVSAGGIDPAPIGSIVSYAGATAPSGYLFCDGSAVSRITYAALFTAIGTTYGAGNGSTTFNLPDLRGEFIRGLDRGRGVDSGRVLGSWQDDLFESHTHRALTLPGGIGGSSGATPVRLDGSVWNSAPIEATGGTETRPRNVALNYIIKAVNNSEMVLVASSTVASIVPAGAVMYFNLTSCPAGWVEANGTGGTPDLRGEFIRGLSNGRAGVDVGRVLASFQSQDMQPHTHTTSMPSTWSVGGSGPVTFFSGGPYGGSGFSGVSSQAGVTETRPRNVALLACVKS